MEKHQNEGFWLPLDNAAKIYPAIRTRELTAVFRISAVLKENIKIKALYSAVGDLENRFPYYKVMLKRGFFWYFLEHKNIAFPIEVDDKIPCRGFKSGKDKLLMRILVIKNTISVEFSHILTDGTGGLEFLKSVLLTYFEKCGAMIPEEIDYHKPGEEANEREFEDAYQRYFKRKLPLMPEYPPAFHLPYGLKKKPRFRTLVVMLPLKDIHRLAKEKQSSITVYLVSVYLMVLQDIFRQISKRDQRKANKIIRIQVPINLRSIYPSETMRNFSLWVMPEIDLRLGEYTFDELLRKVYYLMQLETDKKLIDKTISRNVSGEKRPEIRSIPLFLKSLLLNFKYKSLGTSLYSGVITNLGKINISPEINERIDHFIFTAPPPNTVVRVNCGVVGFDHKLTMCFGNITKSSELENKFIEFLKAQGVPVKTLNSFETNG
jgi:NRPS condensation-like uncharacterized protein